MAFEDQVRGSLESVMIPAARRSIVKMNLVRKIAINEKTVNITLASTGLIPEAQD